MKIKKFAALIGLTVLAGCYDDAAFYAAWSGMEYQTDQEQYGVADKWVSGCPAKGDCEDKVLCLYELMQARGDDVSGAKVVICTLDRYADHVVLYNNGTWYDPTHGSKSPVPLCEPVFYLDYNQALARATYKGAK